MKGKIAYCLHCRAKHEVVGPHNVTKSGRKFMQGKCKKCGGKVSKAVKKTAK